MDIPKKLPQLPLRRGALQQRKGRTQRLALRLACTSVQFFLTVLRIRLLLAWLLMAAVPLQGFAAASMVFCGTGAAHHSQVQAQTSLALAVKQVAQTGHHDHSSHSHADGSESDRSPNPISKGGDDPLHKCGVCASCCLGVAITDFHRAPNFSSLQQAELAEPFVLIHARPSPVPDKPPRA